MTPQDKTELDALLGAFAAACLHGSAESQSAIQTEIHAHINGVLPEYDLLRPVLSSSADLVLRFSGTLTEQGCFAKFDEECSELKEAVRALTALPQAHPQLVQAVAEELIDVLVTAGGIASYAGVPWTEIRAAVDTVLTKNEAKTPLTHHWDEDSKTVVRREG